MTNDKIRGRREGEEEAKPKPKPPGYALPPIDAEPEEIAQVLFQRPPLKKPKAEETDDS